LRIDFPWNDRAGRFSTLYALAFLLTITPALWLAWDAATGMLGPRPVTEAIHRTGDWAVRLLLLSLLLTPLRRITGWSRWVLVRRMIGLSVFFYALAHLVLYALDQSWNIGRVASEIVLRPYLTIGFVALLGLAVLAATSTDRAIRRLGRRWGMLHRIVYLIGVLSLLHFFLQSKINATQAALMMGFFLLLMGWRLAHKVGGRLDRPGALLLVALLAAPLTAGLEALWYGLATSVPWMRVLEANWSLAMWPRPSFWVLAVGLVAMVLPVLPIIAKRLPMAGARSRHGGGRSSPASKATVSPSL